MTSLKEMKSKGTIDNERLLKIIDKCVSDLRGIGYDIGDDIRFDYGDALHTFGTMMWPKYRDDDFTLILNKFMIDEPEDSLRDTILHELAHYINMKRQLKDGIVYWDPYNNSQLRADRSIIRSRKESSHGTEWQRIANNISIRLNLPKPISRTDSYETHKGVGKQYETNVKYVVRCTNCGNEMKFTRKTEFVSNPNATQFDHLLKKYGKSINSYWGSDTIDKFKHSYYWSCGKCNGHNCFEVEEIKH